QRPIGVPVVAVKDSCAVYIVSHRQVFVIIDHVSKGRESSRDAKRCYGSANADERRVVPVAVSKRSRKVAGIVYPKHSGAGRAGNIEFCEGAARQEKPVTVAIAGGVVAADCAWVIDASSFGKAHRIVRINDRIAKATIAEPDKPSRHSGGIDELANDVASFVNLLRQGVISGPGIIKGRDHFNGARARWSVSERPHQREHE